MNKPVVGDIVLYNFKAGNASVLRPALVLSSNDTQNLNLSVMIDKCADGQFGLSPAEMLAGVAWRDSVSKGSANGQWTGKP